MSKQKKTYICTECKRYWIEPKPKYCTCGMSSLWMLKTFQDNAKLAENKESL